MVLIRKIWRTLSFETLVVFSLDPGADGSNANVPHGRPTYEAAHRAKIYRPTIDDFVASMDYMRGKFVGWDTAQMPPTMESDFTRRADI
jgi:hypothetical protein